MAVLVGGALVLIHPFDRADAQRGPRNPLVVFIGDSYTQGVGATSPSHRWTTVLSRSAGWKEDNLGRGGTGYVATSGLSGCGLEYCPNYQQMVSAAVNADPDVVVVSGGQNDFAAWDTDSTKIVSGIDAVFDELRRALPTAAIYAVGPSTTGGVSGPVVSMDQAVRSAASRVHAHFVSLIDPDVIQPSMVLKDGGHVDDAGHAAIARRVLAAVRTGSSS